MRAIILLLKGIIVGVVHIVPGVSSGTFMVLLRVYDELVASVSGLLSSLRNMEELKRRLFFLVPLALGVAIGTVGIAKVASLVLDRYPVLSLLFFIGVIAGDSRPLAVLADGERRFYVRHGGSVSAGWIVTRINAHSVVLKKGGREATLILASELEKTPR